MLRQESIAFSGPTYKIAVVGCGGVGKSALTIQFIKGYFVSDYDPTIEDSYSKVCSIDDVPTKISVLDTAGQEEFQSMQDTFMKCCEGFILVFSLTNRHSLDAIRNIHKQILRVKDRDFIPMVLVGNKCDLAHGSRAVTSDLAKSLARELKLRYIETSAKLNHNVEQAFLDTAKQVKKFYTEDRLPSVNKSRTQKKGCVIV